MIVEFFFEGVVGWGVGRFSVLEGFFSYNKCCIDDVSFSEVFFIRFFFRV